MPAQWYANAASRHVSENEVSYENSLRFEPTKNKHCEVVVQVLGPGLMAAQDQVSHTASQRPFPQVTETVADSKVDLPQDISSTEMPKLQMQQLSQHGTSLQTSDALPRPTLQGGTPLQSPVVIVSGPQAADSCEMQDGSATATLSKISDRKKRKQWQSPK